MGFGAAASTVVEKNVAVPMSDGVTLRVNVFRPDHARRRDAFALGRASHACSGVGSQSVTDE